jgi:hypothetical protein
MWVSKQLSRPVCTCGLMIILLSGGCEKPQQSKESDPSKDEPAKNQQAKDLDPAKLKQVSRGMGIKEVEAILGPGEVVEKERTIAPGEATILGKSDKSQKYNSRQWKVKIKGDSFTIMIPFFDDKAAWGYGDLKSDLATNPGIHRGH